MLLLATRLLRNFLTPVAAGAALLLAAGTTRAQAPNWDLAATGSLTQVEGQSQTRALTTDALGNVFVTGSFTGTVAFGGTVLVSSSGVSDLFVAKYVPGSATWAWAQRGGGTGIDAGYGIAVSGNSVYVTGTIFNNSANASAVQFGGATLAASTVPVNGASTTSSQDLVLVKYTDNGSTATLGWTQVAGGTNYQDQGNGVAVSGTSVYVAGTIFNSTSNANAVVFGGGGTTAGTVQVNGTAFFASPDLVLAKYTDNGATATFGWAQVGGGLNDDFGQGVAVSGSSVYLTGTLTNSATNISSVLFGGSGTTAGTAPQYGTSPNIGTDLVLAKYTDNGSTATLGWTQVGGGTGADQASGVAVSGTSVYLAGTLVNTTTNGSSVRFGGSGTTAGTVVVNGASTTTAGDLVLAKYTDNGTSAAFGWAQVGGGTGADGGTGVAASGSSVYLTGNLTNSSTNANGVVFGGSVAVPGVYAQSGTDWVLAKYQDNGATGSLGWTQVGGGDDGNDQASGVAVRGVQVYAAGSVTVYGGTYSALSFGAANNQAVLGTLNERAMLAQATDAGSTGLWTGLAAATNGGTSYINAVAADASGNLFVTGSFFGEVDLGSIHLSSAGSIDLFVAKYVPATGTWAWAQRGGGTSYDAGLGVAVSGSSVYVTGYITNTSANGQRVSLGGTSLFSSATPVNGTSAASSSDLLLAKYQDNGTSATLRWTQVGGGSTVDQGYAVAVSGTSVYVTGSITNNAANASAVLFGGSGTTAGTVPVSGASPTVSTDLLLAKYTDNGATATLAWTQVGGGTSTDRGYGVAVSGTSVYVTGQFTNNAANGANVLFGGNGTASGTVPVNGASATSSGDLLLAKYQDNGATGSLTWTQVGGGTDDDQGYSVATSGPSVYVTGYLTNNAANANAVRFGGNGTTAGTSVVNGASPTASADLLLAKYTDNGATATLGWTQVGGGTDIDVGYAVAVNSTGVYVAGTLIGSTASGGAAVFGGGGTTAGTVAVPGASATSSYDLLLAKYQDNGTTGSLAWARVGGGPDSDGVSGIALSGQAVYVGGGTAATATYGPTTLSLPGSSRGVLLARVTDTGVLAVAPATPGAAGLVLYPNPAYGSATLTGAEAGATVQVLDALGRVVTTATADAAGTAGLRLPDGLVAGVYVVRAGSSATRLVVE